MAFASKPNPLKDVVHVLDEAAGVANEVAKPIADFDEIFTDALAIVEDLELFITGLNDLDKVAGEIGELLFLLTEIPVVGEVLDVIGAALKDVSVIVGEALIPVNEFKATVLEEARPVLKRISGVTNDVNSAVSGFADKVPQWTKTITVLNFGWSIVSVLVDLLDGTEPGKRLHRLMTKFQSIGSTVTTVFGVSPIDTGADLSEGFQAVWKVMSDVMKPVCSVIKKFGEWLRPVLSAVKFVGEVFHDIRSVIDTVLNAIKPVKWALDAVDCVFEKVVQPVLDWIMKELGIKALMDEFAKKLEGALHLSDVEEKLSGVLDGHKLKGADGSMSTSHDKASSSKMKKLDDALGEFVSSPQQTLMAAILTAISGTPVLPGAFPPPLPDLPPLKIQRHEPSSSETQMFAVKRVARALEAAAPRSLSPLPAVAAPKRVSSPKDWSDVDRFTTDIDSICGTLKPILDVGQELEKFLRKAHEQMGKPAELHARLTQLSDLVNFLHDVSQFLQQFPLFNAFLPALTTSLGEEQKAITGLDSDMSQFVKSVSSLSDSLKPIVAAESPTLAAAIHQLTTTLGNWKSQALKYRDQLQHAYDLEKKKNVEGKFATRIDALATTFHGRIAKLQGMLNQVKDLAERGRDGGSALEKSLDSVTSQFDQVDPHIDQLKGHIQKVAQVSHYAAQLDAIFQALQWMLQEYKCVGDKHGIKANSLEPFKLLSSISEDPAVKDEFQQLYSKLLEEFFPVHGVDSTVKDGESAVAAAIETIKKTSPGYLEALTSLQKLQVGPYTYKYYRKATKFDIKDPNAFKCKYHDKPTKQAVTIDSHFFSEDEVHEALQLGQDMSNA